MAAIAAMLTPLFANALIDTGPALLTGYPPFAGVSIPWTGFYLLATIALTMASGTRTLALAAIAIAPTTVSLLAHDRVAAAGALLATTAACAVTLRWRGTRFAVPTKREQWILWLPVLVIVPVAFFAGQATPSAVAAAAAPFAAETVDVLTGPDGVSVVVLVASGEIANLASSDLGIVTLRRTAPGYWEPVPQGGRPAGSQPPRLVTAFAHECEHSRPYAMAADRSGVCLLRNRATANNGRASILMGLAPANAVVAEATGADGRTLRHALAPGPRKGYAFWGGDDFLQNVARVAFYDAEDRLLDARVGPRMFDGTEESFARLAAGCAGRAQCPNVNSEFIVSMSLLRPDEFSRFCGRPPSGQWSLLASVFVATHDTQDYPGRAQSDRRLLGPAIARFVMGVGDGGSEVRTLPSENEPCFPPER